MKRFQVFIAAFAVCAVQTFAAQPLAAPLSPFISATAACGCTKPKVPKQPVAPGDTAVVVVSYDPYGRPGEFNKTVTVKTNAKPSKLKLRITGTVIPGK